MLMRKALVIGSTLFLIVAAPLWAGDEAVGTTSANFLKIPAHARPAGMAEAYTAVSNDEAGMMYNPAGLARAPRHEISATHIEWFQGIRLEHIGGLVDLGALGAVGASLTWLQVGELVRTERVANGPDPLANFNEIGTFNPYDMGFSVAYARPFAKRYVLGARINTLQQAIDSDAGWGFGLDLGAQMENVFQGLDLGLMVTNIGSEIGVGNTSFGQPLMINAGALLRLFNNKWRLSSDVEVPLDNKVELAFGTEVDIADVMTLRAGWRGGFANQLNFGGGMRVAMLRVDYAYSPFLDLGGTHRVTATYAWGIPGINLGVAQKLLAPLGYPRFHRTAYMPDPGKPEMVKSWSLQIIDEAGHAAKTWQGDGAPPESEPWDGRDDAGMVLPDQMVQARLNVEFLGGGTRHALSEKVELDSTPPKMGLDIEPKVVKPDGQGAILIPATIKMSATDKNDISAWKVSIKDKKGNEFWSQSGQGRPPAQVVWDGTNGKGKYVDSGSTYIAQMASKDGPGNLAVSEPVAQVVLLREIKLQIASDALFDPGKADVKISAYHQLKDVVALIRKHNAAGETVEIGGHTDNEPVVHSVYGSNMALSLARAKAVVKFMEDLLKVDDITLVPKGYGDTRPIADNSTPEGRLKNRRVEVRIQMVTYE